MAWILQHAAHIRTAFTDHQYTLRRKLILFMNGRKRPHERLRILVGPQQINKGQLCDSRIFPGEVTCKFLIVAGAAPDLLYQFRVFSSPDHTVDGMLRACGRVNSERGSGVMGPNKKIFRPRKKPERFLTSLEKPGYRCQKVFIQHLRYKGGSFVLGISLGYIMQRIFWIMEQGLSACVSMNMSRKIAYDILVADTGVTLELLIEPVCQ